MLRARISLKVTKAAGLGYSRPSSSVVKSPLWCWTGTVGGLADGVGDDPHVAPVVLYPVVAIAGDGQPRPE